MHAFDSLSTIIFALVALVVFWKLRSVLGERTGSERPPRDIFGRQDSSRDTRESMPPPRGNPGSNVVRLPPTTASTRTAGGTPPDRWRGFAEPDSATARGLDAIADAEPSFAAGSFLEGAKIAYEAIITAFAAGERKTLQNLLAPDVYASFATELDARQRRGETVSTTIVSLDDATIESASLAGQMAQVTVRFAAKLITATHDASGAVIEGSPDRAVAMNDVWSFARDVRSRDPNWKLVATESGH